MIAAIPGPGEIINRSKLQVAFFLLLTLTTWAQVTRWTDAKGSYSRKGFVMLPHVLDLDPRLSTRGSDARSRHGINNTLGTPPPPSSLTHSNIPIRDLPSIYTKRVRAITDIMPLKAGQDGGHLDLDYNVVGERAFHDDSSISGDPVIDRAFASDEEGRLIRDLFRNYNKLIRPVKNKTDHINVAFGLSLIQLINVNEREQIMKTNVWLQLKWNDFQLVWTPQDYGNIKTIRIPYSRIWTPDIVLFNNADGKYEVSTKCNVVLNYDGGVLWVPPSIYKSSCTIDVEYFPFDEQHCIMRFGSWTFNGDEVGFSFFDDREFIDLNDFSVSGTWDVINVPAFLNIDNRTRPTVTDVSFHMYIRRKTLFYTVNLLAPCIMMSFLSVLVFYLPPDGNEKITLGISILLAIVLFQLVVSKLLPPTSLTIPLIAKYLLFTFVMNLICVLFTVIIVNWNFRAAKTHHLPRWLRTLFIDILPKFIFMRRPQLARPSKPDIHPFNGDGDIDNYETDENDWSRSKSTVTTTTPGPRYEEKKERVEVDITINPDDVTDYNAIPRIVGKFKENNIGVNERSHLNTDPTLNSEEFGNYETAYVRKVVCNPLTAVSAPLITQGKLISDVISGGNVGKVPHLLKSPSSKDSLPNQVTTLIYKPHSLKYNEQSEVFSDNPTAFNKCASKPVMKHSASKTTLLKSKDNSLELSEFHKNLNNYRFASTSNPKDFNDEDVCAAPVRHIKISQSGAKLHYPMSPSHFLTEKDLREIEELARLEHDITNFGYPSNGSSENDANNNSKTDSFNDTYTDSCLSDKEFVASDQIVMIDPSGTQPGKSLAPNLAATTTPNQILIKVCSNNPVQCDRKVIPYQTSRTNTIVRQNSIDLGLSDENTPYDSRAYKGLNDISGAAPKYVSPLPSSCAIAMSTSAHPKFTIPSHPKARRNLKETNQAYFNENVNNNNNNDDDDPGQNSPYLQHQSHQRHQVVPRNHNPTTGLPVTSPSGTGDTPYIMISGPTNIIHNGENVTNTGTLVITNAMSPRHLKVGNITPNHKPRQAQPLKSISNDTLVIPTRSHTPPDHDATNPKRTEDKSGVMRRRRKHFPHIPSRIVRGTAKEVIFVARHLKLEDENNMEREDWKYIAIVIDRILLYIFIIVTLGGTLGIITNAPHIFEYVDQQERIQYLTGQKTA